MFMLEHSLCGVWSVFPGYRFVLSFSDNVSQEHGKKKKKKLSRVASPELSKTIALRQTNSSGLSLSMRKREVVASSMSKISAIPSTQSPSFL